MNKRLRKKKRVGEFRELGFRVRFETPGLSAEQVDALCDCWLAEAIEPNGLSCGGCCGPVEWDGLVPMDAPGSGSQAPPHAVHRIVPSACSANSVGVNCSSPQTPHAVWARIPFFGRVYVGSFDLGCSAVDAVPAAPCYSGQPGGCDLPPPHRATPSGGPK